MTDLSPGYSEVRENMDFETRSHPECLRRG